ncbi:hypothetical protein BBP40_002665 [Aspergillus hancockii]|nr:hypothetical protein BBP40_002665 [Aspergillus hancockii]
MLRVTNPSITSLYRYGRVSPLSRRTYAHSSYGAEGETKAQQTNNPTNSPTRDIEHPGPAPPDVGQKDIDSKASKSHSSSSTTQQDRDREDPGGKRAQSKTSNDAHPTITDGRQSPNVDSDGNVRANVPKDVKKHNEEMEQRYDRSYNQIGDEGKIHKGF